MNRAVTIVSAGLMLIAGPVHPSSLCAASLEAGKSIATQRCAGCHAIGPSGDGPHKDAPPFRDIAARYDVSNLAEAFAEGITVGHPDMPQFVLGTDEIGSLLDYLASLAPQGSAQPAKRK